MEQKKSWEDQGTAVCGEPPRAADQVPDYVSKANAAKTQVKILKSSQDKLVNIAQSMEDEADEKSKEVLIDMI